MSYNGWSYSWRAGRQLANMSNGTAVMQFNLYGGRHAVWHDDKRGAVSVRDEPAGGRYDGDGPERPSAMLVHIRRVGQRAVYHRRGYGDRRIKPDPVQRVLSGCGDGVVLSPKPVL